MKKRFLAILMTMVMVLGMVPVTAMAEEIADVPEAQEESEDEPKEVVKEIYVSKTGSDESGDGSKENPYATLANAVAAAKNGNVIVVMSDLTMKECARYKNKDLTIISDENGPHTITRDKDFNTQGDNARSWYNPAMIEVGGDVTGEPVASLRLENIILDDNGEDVAERAKDLYYLQADSEGDGATTYTYKVKKEEISEEISNTKIVWDAMIATYNDTGEIILGDGAVLKDYVGMSAVRLADGYLKMEEGSTITAPAIKDRTKGAGGNGSAGAVWMQGGELVMEEGSEITDVVGRAVYIDSGEATIDGTISNITADGDMWQGTSGVALHIRNGLNAENEHNGTKATLGGTGEIAYIAKGAAVDVLQGCHFEMEKDSEIHDVGYNINDNNEVINKGRVNAIGTLGKAIVFMDGEIYDSYLSHAIQLSDSYAKIGKTGYIHNNEVNYGTLYVQVAATADVYGRINNNHSNDRGGGIAMANHGQADGKEEIVNLYEKSELKNNISDQTGGGLMVCTGICTMYGGEISGNIAKNEGGGVFVRQGGTFIMKDGVIANNSTAYEGGAIAFRSNEWGNLIPKVELLGGTIENNVSGVKVDRDSDGDFDVSGGKDNNFAIYENEYGHVNRYFNITDDVKVGNPDVYFVTDTKTLTPVDYTDLKLGNASSSTKTILAAESSAKDWSAPLQTLWCADPEAATHFLLSMPLNAAKDNSGNVLPFYALVVATAEDGTVAEGAKVEVYGVPVNADGKLDVSFLSGKENGYAVAIVQPTQDYGTLTIEADPTELKENKNASEYKVSYEAVYTLSQNLASLFEKTKSGDAEITLQLDENIAYVENSLKVTSNTYKKVSESYNNGVLTVKLELLSDITTAAAGDKTILTLDTTMSADKFNKGEVLATTGEMLINIPGSTDVTIPGNVAMTVMKELDEAVVTFDPNGGEWDDDADEPLKVTVKIGEEVDQPDTPSRSGYRFKGWEDEDGNKWDFDEPVEGDMTLFARWEKKSNGGGGNHKPPVVEDEKEDDNKGGSNEQPEMVLGDVLNGGDHFAYVAGYPDGMVRPQQNITRAETAAIFYRLLNADVREANTTTEHNFSDVPAGEWYEVHVATLSAMGILSGRDNGTFDPNAPITRAEFAAICARFDKGEVEVNQTFKDIAEHWAKDEIEHAAARGWVSGYPDGSYLPEQKITRAEAMVIINRALCRVPETVDDLLPGMKTWVDNQPGDWYYLPVQEATNGHTFEYKDATYERWIELTDVFENNN